jgi:hypothetical protein
MIGGKLVNKNWRKRYNKKLMLLLGDLDILLFVRTSRSNWRGHVNRMDSERKVNQVFNNNSVGRRLRDDQKTDGGTVYKQILINAKLQTGMRGLKTGLSGRS